MNLQPSVYIPFGDLPEGTVTFLFTDIEGSTKLLGSLRERYTEVLADHHRLLREAFTNWHGHEVGTQGDSFFVAFSRATQAVSAAVEAQRKLHEHAWPQDVTVRVRMGIHTASRGAEQKATWVWTCTGRRASPTPATAGRCCSPRRQPP